jgi:hypothetical protein
MPYYYDVTQNCTGAITEYTNAWVKTAANQETLGISGFYAASRFGTAGGAQFRVKTNTGSTASGGAQQTPVARNLRSPSPLSVWNLSPATGTSTITAGGGPLALRVSVGFAQTGGMGGWVATEPTNKIQMQPNATNPIDTEFTSITTSASVTFDMTVEFGEGI